MVDVVVFTSTVLIIFLHAVEWFNVGILSRTLPTEAPSAKLVVLKVSLGVEMVYYLLLLAVFVVFYSGNLIFLTLIALLGLVHLVAFQASVGGASEKMLRKLTMRRVVGVLAFDGVEVLILLALAVQFYPMFVCYFACYF